MSNQGKEAAVKRGIPVRVVGVGAFSTKNLVKTAILAAIATVLMYMEIGMPFVMPWLKLDFSEVPALLAAFSMGPLAGIFVDLIKNAFKCLNTNSGFVGEIASFITGVCLVVPAGWIYRRYHTRKGAMLGLSVGVVLFCIAGALLNIYVLLPLYATLFMGSTENVIAMAQGIYPSIQSLVGVAVIGTTPFNAFKGIAVSAVTLLLYKPLSPLLRK